MMRLGTNHFYPRRTLSALTLACLLLTRSVQAAPSGGWGNVIQVNAGGSIQAAINGAQYGDQIVVESGTYAEQLLIDKDGISLIGQGAILVPPASPASNICSGLAGDGTEAGICVTGSGVSLAPFVSEHRKVLSVDKPITAVSITGFQVRSFSGLSIAVVAGQNTHITDNQLLDGAKYGLLSVGSRDTQSSGNTIGSSGDLLFIGLCTDDMSGVRTTHNHLSGYFVGLCIQTSNSEQEYNEIEGCCTAAFIDPGVNGAKFLHNHIGAMDPRCATEWPYNSGLIVDGAIDSQVQFNLVEGQKSGGVAAGIAIVDDPTVTPLAVASGNLISKNILRDNDFDLFLNTTGSGNVVTDNQCTTPAELCA